MKATRFLTHDSGLAGAWAKLTQVLIFDPLRRDDAPRERLPRQTNTRPGGLLDRLDHWFWRQAQREREAYLAGARNIYELEQRIRRLERFPGSRYG